MITMAICTVLSVVFIFIKRPASCLSNSHFCWQKILQMLIGLLIRTGVSFCAAFVYIYAEEVYPATVAHVALGFSNSIGTMGNLVAPFVITLADSKHFSPLIFEAILGVMVMIVIFYMKETLH